jgi:glutamyl-Q tRNA(Asp) synthetase
LLIFCALNKKNQVKMPLLFNKAPTDLDLSPPMLQQPDYCGRFAPSPTGPLHLGSLVTALASYWHARQQHGGRWLIRIDDIDPLREVKGAAAGQIECLKRFELHPDGPICYQSQRHERYLEILNSLKAQHQVFECRCSRSELASSNGIHRKCVAQPTQSHISWRLKVKNVPVFFDDLFQGYFEQNLYQEVGDVVLKRADGFWAYHLATAVDDADQGITHIIRGADLLDSTPRQIYLQQLFNAKTAVYGHIPLVLDPSGHKLSKSELSVPVDFADALHVMQLAWKHLGQAPDVMKEMNTVSRFHQHAAVHFQPQHVPRMREVSAQ